MQWHKPAAGALPRLMEAAPHLLTAGALVAGWVLVTVGVAHYLGGTVWALSIGLFLLSVVVGLRPLAEIAWLGVYALSRDEQKAVHRGRMKIGA